MADAPAPKNTTGDNRNTMGKPVSEALMNAAKSGVRSVLSTAATWFGPAEPMQPMAPPTPENKGRKLDYPYAVNQNSRPRSEQSDVPFETLRALADSHDILRLVIETRKDQMARLPWTIKLRKDKANLKAAEKKKEKMIADPAIPFDGKTPAPGATPKPGDKKPEVDPKAPVAAAKADGAVPAPPAKPAVPGAPPEVEPPPPVDPVQELLDEIDPVAEDLIKFFKRPDGVTGWDEWMRAVLEDVLVIDAPCLYPRRTLGGDMYGFEPVDGATIKLVVDQRGRVPLAPNPAYTQQIKGMTATHYTCDELIYKPRNPRTHKLYGMSPVEQVIITVNIAIRRCLHQLAYYEDGTVPDALVGVPSDWNTDAVREFQLYFDDLLKDPNERRKMRFVPGEIAKNFHETKQPPLKDLYDEWLARVVCYAFSIEATPFVAQVNRAVADTNREQSTSEGLVPLKKWFKNLMDDMIEKYMLQPDYEFEWEEEKEINKLDQSTVHKNYVDMGVLEINEVRDELGLKPHDETKLAAIAEAKKPPPPPALDPDGKPAAPGDKPVKADEKTEKSEIHVHVPAPEVFVEVGGTTVHAHMDGVTKSAKVEGDSACSQGI